MLLGVLFSAISHESTQGSQVAITLATLFIATLFQPLRGKIQRGINQRFYRSAYDAAQTIEAFAAKLSSLVDIEQSDRERVEHRRRHDAANVRHALAARRAPQTSRTARSPIETAGD